MKRADQNFRTNSENYTDRRLQERHLRKRHGLSEPAARVIAVLYYGEAA